MLTRVGAIKYLRKLVEEEDAEIAHAEADRVLCELLATLGCGDVVEEWEKVRKWYA